MKKLQKFLAMLLTFSMITSMLNITAFAAETICEFPGEHTHTDACDGLVLTCTVPACEKIVHTHDDGGCQPHVHEDSCYTQTCIIEEGLTCTKGEHTHGSECCTQTHQHGEDCEEGCTLAHHGEGCVYCSVEEHSHEADCYHTHSVIGGCYTQTCGQTEGNCEREQYTHSTDCHVHGDICYAPGKICGYDYEHTHVEDCYPITGTITENMVWEEGDVVSGVTINDDVTITVKGTVTVAGTIRPGNNVTFVGEGNGATLIRGKLNAKSAAFTGQMFYVEGSSYNFKNLTISNLTLDGGAVWDEEVIDPILNRGTVNNGIKATGSILYLVKADATLNNCVLQNHDDGTGEKANAVFLRDYATVTFNDSVVRNNNSPSGYWKGGVVATRYGGSVTASDSDVYGNSAAYGGFVGVSSSGSYGTKVTCTDTQIHNNYASTAGAAFYLQDNGTKDIATFGDNSPAYVELTGCTLKNNGSPRGLFYSHEYYMPAWLEDTIIADNDCSMYEYNTDNRTFSVAGSTQISSNHSAYLYQSPVRIYGVLASSASIPMSEASVSKLMDQYGYLATATPAIPADIHTDASQHYNYTGKDQHKVVPYEYTSRSMYDITLDDLAQVELYENSGYTYWDLTDVDGNGMLDAVPVNAEPTTVTVTLNDTFKGISETDTQDVSTTVANVPICYYEHTGYFFNGWLNGGTLIKDASSHAILGNDTALTAAWAVARPRVEVAADKDSDTVGKPITLTATVTNKVDTLNYTYQWYRDGSAIPDATNPVLSVTEDDTSYHVYKCQVVATDPTYTSDTDYFTKTNYGTNTYYNYIILKWAPKVYVAQIVETGVKYETLAEAVADANASEGADTIKMLKDIDFDSDEALSIVGNVTIIGNHTISRGGYTGTLFIVPEGSSLTLDGNLVLDGDNKWKFDETAYNNALANAVIGNAASDFVTPQTNGTTAEAPMFVVNGSLIANDVTIQNNYSTGSGNNGEYAIFQVNANASLTMTGATITHVTTGGASTVAHLASGATWTIKDGTVISDNFSARNGGLCRNDGGTIIMTGGTIENNYAVNASGHVFMMWSEGAHFEMSGGTIENNSSVRGANNEIRTAAVYLHSNSTMHMTGGIISGNTGYQSGGIISKRDVGSNLTIEGGLVTDNVSIVGNERHDVETNGNAVAISGGIYTHDVDDYCAAGYICIPYDQDVSDYCDTSYAPRGYDEDTHDSDFIVVPGYRICYYVVEANAETEEPSEQLVHKAYLLIPLDGSPVFAEPYEHMNSERTQVIKTWYTTNEMEEGSKYDYSTAVTENFNLYGAEWETVSTGGDDSGGTGSTTPGGNDGGNEGSGGTGGTTPGGNDDGNGSGSGTGAGSDVVEIPDGEVPLTPVPGQEEIPDEEVPLTPGSKEEEILEEDVPLANVPKTGDMAALWLTLNALSGTVLAGASILGRKKRED